MRFFRKSKFLAVVTLTVFYVASCSTKSEDDASLEEKEPVEASAEKVPADSSGSPSAPAAPEAKPAESVAAPAASGASVESSASMASSARRVMYVKSNGVAMREKAEPKAKVVGKLGKGDHILVTIEGEWARTDDGKFISMKSLSEKGIGRVKKDASWSGGVSSAEPVAAKASESAAEPAKKLPKKTVSGGKKSAVSKGAESAPVDQVPSTAAPVDEQP